MSTLDQEEKLALEQKLREEEERKRKEALLEKKKNAEIAEVEADTKLKREKAVETQQNSLTKKTDNLLKLEEGEEEGEIVDTDLTKDNESMLITPGPNMPGVEKPPTDPAQPTPQEEEGEEEEEPLIQEQGTPNVNVEVQEYSPKYETDADADFGLPSLEGMPDPYVEDMKSIGEEDIKEYRDDLYQAAKNIGEINEVARDFENDYRANVDEYKSRLNRLNEKSKQINANPPTRAAALARVSNRSKELSILHAYLAGVTGIEGPMLIDQLIDAELADAKSIYQGKKDKIGEQFNILKEYKDIIGDERMAERHFVKDKVDNIMKELDLSLSQYKTKEAMVKAHNLKEQLKAKKVEAERKLIEDANNKVMDGFLKTLDVKAKKQTLAKGELDIAKKRLDIRNKLLGKGKDDLKERKFQLDKLKFTRQLQKDVKAEQTSEKRYKTEQEWKKKKFETEQDWKKKNEEWKKKDYGFKVNKFLVDQQKDKQKKLEKEEYKSVGITFHDKDSGKAGRKIMSEILPKVDQVKNFRTLAEGRGPDQEMNTWVRGLKGKGTIGRGLEKAKIYFSDVVGSDNKKKAWLLNLVGFTAGSATSKRIDLTGGGPLTASEMGLLFQAVGVPVEVSYKGGIPSVQSDDVASAVLLGMANGTLIPAIKKLQEATSKNLISKLTPYAKNPKGIGTSLRNYMAGK